MAGPICDWPPGTGQTGAGGCHFGSPVSIVATRHSGEGRGAARGGLSDGNGLAVNVRAGQEWMEDNKRSHEAVFHPGAC